MLVTDGIYTFLGRSWQQQMAAADRSYLTPPDLVAGLVDAASRGGAGDNGAVVAYRPGVAPTD